MAAPGVVLALDLATRTGWCAGRPGERPRFGVWQLRGMTPGERYAALDDILRDSIKIHQPTEIVFEAPLVRGDHAGINAGRLALGFVAIVELVAYDHSLRVSEVYASQTRKAVLGRGNFEKGKAKEAVAAWCNANGFDPPDDNAADAVVLWKHVEQLRMPRMAGAA